MSRQGYFSNLINNIIHNPRVLLSTIGSLLSPATNHRKEPPDSRREKGEKNSHKVWYLSAKQPISCIQCGVKYECFDLVEADTEESSNRTEIIHMFP